MYRIEIRRVTQKTLDRLPKRDFEAVVESLRELADTPRPRGIEKIKSTSLWRIRQGDYRIVYSIHDQIQTVIVVRIGHRREIYRRF